MKCLSFWVLQIGTVGVHPVKAQGDSALEHGKVFTRLEHPATFPGGIAAWERYLSQHLMYPAAARKKQIKASVKLWFVVDTTGKIWEVMARNDPGYGMVQEAKRVLTAGPLWIPGRQKNQKVVCTREIEIQIKPD